VLVALAACARDDADADLAPARETGGFVDAHACAEITAWAHEQLEQGAAPA